MATTKSFTKVIGVSENAWGNVQVNGKKLTGSGTLDYNETTGNYYVENRGVTQYYKHMKGTDWQADVTIDITNAVKNDLAGILITNGKYDTSTRRGRNGRIG